MVAKPVALRTFRWNSIKDAKAAFQKILHNYGLNEQVTDPTHTAMLYELLDRHPHGQGKIGVGIDYFYIGRSEQEAGAVKYWNGRGIWIRRVDGSREDLGYSAALAGASRKVDAKDAMRHAVSFRRDAYREGRYASGSNVTCFLTGVPLAGVEAQVIYVNPAWEQLTYRFAQAEGGFDQIEISSGNGAAEIGGRLADPEVLQRWLKFFDEHAHMELASRSAAARRPWPDEAAWDPTI